MVITLSIHYIEINFIKNLKLNMALIVVLLICYGYIARRETLLNKLYILLTSLIICTSYVTFQLFKLYDPVWLIFEERLMLSGIIIYLILMLHKSQKNRFLTLIIGSAHGEFLYKLITAKLDFYIEIGSHFLLDIMAVCSLFFIGWYLLENLSYVIDTQSKRHNKKGRVLNE